MALAITKVAGDLPSVFGIIGALFGPICGAMAVDYFLAGRRWSGPRAGFNPAGWIAWALGFVVGILPNLHAWKEAIPSIPAAPIAAFLVGAAVYFACAKAGLLSPVIPAPTWRKRDRPWPGKGGFRARPCSFHLPGHEGRDQPGGPCARHDDPVAGEELIVGERVAPILDAAPVDLQDLVMAAEGMRADQIGLLRQAVGLEPRLEDGVEHRLVARIGNRPWVLTVPIT